MLVTVRAIVSQLNTGAKRAKFTIFHGGKQAATWINYKDRTTDPVRVGHFVSLTVDDDWLEQELTGENT